jgi:hypothetical protein
MDKLKEFTFEGKEQAVSLVETMYISDGVECDVYKFIDDLSKDLGIIKISEGCKTPLQKVLKGERTIEGYLSGKGKLTVIKLDAKKEVYIADGEFKKPVINVGIGELMQWRADEDSELVAYEICFPPYEDGRYENVEKSNK